MLPTITRATPAQVAAVRHKLQAAACPAGWLWDNSGQDRPDALTTEEAARIIHLLDLRIARHQAREQEVADAAAAR